MTSRKYAAHAYVDDRAVAFTGDRDQVPQAIAALSPVPRAHLGRT
ncbi:hypothetical protein [Nonomuraea phyllanthi]|nr:hypothetical protein [Nonomuraea phyllanthi]